eukprot:440942-Prorocentrum_minimum.AAC.1
MSEPSSNVMGRTDTHPAPLHLRMLTSTLNDASRQKLIHADQEQTLLASRRAVDARGVVKNRQGVRLLRLQPKRLRVVYVGGSITAQRAGWRPRVQEWLNERIPVNLDHYEFSASMGNVGSKVLAFVTDDWVNTHAPDLVFIETVVNDGDNVLETGDEAGIGRALEGAPSFHYLYSLRFSGRHPANSLHLTSTPPHQILLKPLFFAGIVRGISAFNPAVTIVFVYMFVRDDLPSERRTGTEVRSIAPNCTLCVCKLHTANGFDSLTHKLPDLASHCHLSMMTCRDSYVPTS